MKVAHLIMEDVLLYIYKVNNKRSSYSLTYSIIYCDIPYKDTKQYATSKNFDHDKFWQWCRDMTKQGHKVFISEYQAPDDFICVWSKEVTNSMNTTLTYKPVERLFVYGG